MADFYINGDRTSSFSSFPYGVFKDPEEWVLVSESPTKVVVQPNPKWHSLGPIVEIIGNDLVVDSAPQNGWSVGSYPTKGTITEIIHKQAGFTSRYVGSLDAAEMSRRGYDMKGNWDDDRVKVNNYLFGGNDNIYIYGNTFEFGYGGDDNYVFLNNSKTTPYSVGRMDSFNEEGGPNDASAGIDTAVFQKINHGITATVAQTVEKVLGTAFGDVIDTAPHTVKEGIGFPSYIYKSGQFIDAGSGNDLIRGSIAGETLKGSAGNDTIYGDVENSAYTPSTVEGTLGDVLDGGSGDDAIHSGANDDVLRGTSGNDLLYLGGGRDQIDGGSGRDTVSLEEVKAGGAWTIDLVAGTVTEIRDGSSFVSTIVNVDRAIGSEGEDVIRGSNRLEGRGGDDRLEGAASADALIGGDGADTFVFSSIADSSIGGRDRILDFSAAEDDKLDLLAIDADTNAAGNQDFAFIGTGGFTGAGGELRVSYRASGDAVVTVDVDGDRAEDMNILLRGVTAETPLKADDFLGVLLLG